MADTGPANEDTTGQRPLAPSAGVVEGMVEKLRTSTSGFTSSPILASRIQTLAALPLAQRADTDLAAERLLEEFVAWTVSAPSATGEPDRDDPVVRIVELASAIGCLGMEHELPVVVNPPPMLRRCLWSEATGGLMRDDAATEDLDPEQLPDMVCAMSVDYHGVLMGYLGDAPEEDMIRDRLRRLHNQAAIAQSWLGVQGEDLHLVLTGPPGSDQHPEWRRFGREIERDERICRKLVWLPPADPEALDASREAFLCRTFLARPWKDCPEPEQGALDWMERLLANVTSGTVTPEMTKRWFDLLEQADIDRDELVEGLVAALEQKT